MSDTILVIGSSGQIGTELVAELRKQLGEKNVIATDIHAAKKEEGIFEKLDVLDGTRLLEIVKKYQVTEIYHLAALLSATAEQNMKFAWKLNMEGLFNVLDIAKENNVKKVFWPSSIAVFGPTTPATNTPQQTIIEPSTVYGISKLAGERWCEYYFLKYGLDVRSIRYPGLIGYKSAPGGGTTDYAVHIFHEAIKKGTYDCFLKEDTVLPMMYMPDALTATIKLMNSPASNIKIRSSYNVAAISFSPKELTHEITKYIPEFTCTYHADYRQKIADTWPQSIDDTLARTDWKWKNKYDLRNMTEDMISNIRPVYASKSKVVQA